MNSKGSINIDNLTTMMENKEKAKIFYDILLER